MILREEYKNFIKNKEKTLDEAVLLWLKENVILINENISDKEIQIFNNRLAALSNLVNKFNNKIPELNNLLVQAEKDVSDYLSGSVKEKFAHVYLLRLTYLSNIISKFFSKRIKNLVSSHLFSAPKKHGDVKLNVLSEPGYNPETIKTMFVNNLNSIINESNIMLKKFEKNEMPKIDTNLIASELLNLSFNELQELIGLEPVKIMTPEKTNEPAQETQVVAEETQLLQEVDIDLLNKVKIYNKAITTLKRTPGLDKMPNLLKTVNDVDKKINSALSSKTGSLVNTLQSIWGGDMDSQLNKLTQYLKLFTEVWTSIRDKYSLDTNDDQTNLVLNPDKTIKDLVGKLVKDKNLTKDFLEQTPKQLEEFSNSLTNYFNDLKGTPAAEISKQDVAPVTPKTKAPEIAQAPEETSTTTTSTTSEIDVNQLADEVAAQIGLKSSQIPGIVNLFTKMSDKGFQITKK